MNEWFKLVLLILVCYRLARLLALDEGPAIFTSVGIFLTIRKRLGAYDYTQNGWAATNLGRGVACSHCWGLWLALILTLIFYPLEWYNLVYWLAIAGGQSFLQECNQHA